MTWPNDAGPNDEARGQPSVPMRASLARSSSWVSFAFGISMRSLFYLSCAGLMALMIGCLRPRYVASSDSCINQLRQIDGAKQQWMIGQHKTTNDVPTWNDIRPYLSRDGKIPVCPRGGRYSIERLDELPTCSYRAHTLQ